jgi:hypothetical protein
MCDKLLAVNTGKRTISVEMVIMRKNASEVRQPFQFAWEVPEGVYQCEQGYALDAEKPELSLVERTPIGVARKGRLHRILREESGLFLEFAKVDLTPEGVIAFANRYGALGGKLRRPVTIGSPRAKQQSVYSGEALGAWFREISAVRRLLPVWDQDRKPEIIFKTDPESITASWPAGVEVVVFRATEPDIYERLRDKPTEIARHYLRTQINLKLLEHPSTGRLLEERSRGELALFIVPSSLIAAIWLQFACAIDGNRKYRPCKNCKKWFELGGRGRRADAEACSDSCRAAFAYKEKQKAKEKQKPTRRRKRP